MDGGRWVVARLFRLFARPEADCRDRAVNRPIRPPYHVMSMNTK